MRPAFRSNMLLLLYPFSQNGVNKNAAKCFGLSPLLSSCILTVWD